MRTSAASRCAERGSPFAMRRPRRGRRACLALPVVDDDAAHGGSLAPTAHLSVDEERSVDLDLYRSTAGFPEHVDHVRRQLQPPRWCHGHEGTASALAADGDDE